MYFFKIKSYSVVDFFGKNCLLGKINSIGFICIIIIYIDNWYVKLCYVVKSVLVIGVVIIDIRCENLLNMFFINICIFKGWFYGIWSYNVIG